MSARIRHCVECPKCRTRYLIAFSPYGNGSCLVPAIPGSSDEYTLYCACGTPPACSQWKWSEVRAYTVTKTAHDRGFGTYEEIVLTRDDPGGTGTFDMVPSESDRKRERLEVKRIRWSVRGIALTVTLLAGLHSLAAQALTSVKSNACMAPEYREFDFWFGDWDVFDEDSPTIVVAHARVDGILDGCVLREDYQDTNGPEGQSFSLYEAARRVWHQSWVTNRGKLLVIEGKMQSGEMVLSGADQTADGKERRVRGTWKAVKGGVRETAVTLIDGGRTWQPWFDLMFRSQKPSGGAHTSIV